MKLDLVPIAIFQEKTVPEGTRLAGWAALVHALAIPAPVRRPSCVSEQHIRGSRRKEGAWTVFDKRYWPGDSLADHITFALRHEEIDLLILKRIFEAVPPGEIEAFVRAAPTGTSARRAWYLYETLTGRTLDVDDAPAAHGHRSSRPQGVLYGETAPFEAAPRARQSSGHRPVLPGHPAHQSSHGVPDARPLRQGAGNRWAYRRPSGRARRQLHAAGRQPGQLRDRGRASAAQPAGAMGPRCPAGREEPAHARRNRPPARRPDRGHAVRACGPASRRRLFGRTGSPRRSAPGIHRRKAG